MNSFKVVSITVLFALSLHKNSVPDRTKYLQNHYEYSGLKGYRKLPNQFHKLEKCKLDLFFPTKCKTYDLIPKFLHFKLYLGSIGMLKPITDYSCFKKKKKKKKKKENFCILLYASHLPYTEQILNRTRKSPTSNYIIFIFKA